MSDTELPPEGEKVDKDDNEAFEFDRPSKSQRKRDMQALKELATRLTTLSSEALGRVEPPELVDAVVAATRIHKGSARKRQIQYIAKLLSRIDTDPIVQIIDEIDASSTAYVRKFHQLEQWREKLIGGDQSSMNEICQLHPDVDRQQLRQLVRQASAEHRQGEQGTAFRKLFQFLKALESQ